MSVDAVQYQGEVIQQMPLAAYTTWRVGGVADRIYMLKDLSALSNLLKQLPPQQPITWLGLGSNTLIRDGGIAGTTIVGRQGLTQLTQLEEGVVYAEAAVSCGRLARFSAQCGLTGLEFLAGVPGTVGGALQMNAGCYGSEIWQWVKQVTMINRYGQCCALLSSAFEVSYRQVLGPKDSWFSGAYFLLKSGNKEKSLNKIRTILANRCATQPTSLPSCGSVFRNPDGDHAARLIEMCGLKGYSIGGAMVSPKHANFIVNCGGATASDIERLINHVAEVVEEKTAVKLQREVKIIGRYKQE